jgi:dihydrodipicolinate synthase/N-acetylneuraminate lyase
VKETTRDFEHFSRVLQVAGRDTLVWSGIELLCLPLLSLTGAGQQTVLRLLKAGAPVLDGPVATVAG